MYFKKRKRDMENENDSNPVAAERIRIENLGKLFFVLLLATLIIVASYLLI